jgi:hypothetical protein
MPESPAEPEFPPRIKPFVLQFLAAREQPDGARRLVPRQLLAAIGAHGDRQQRSYLEWVLVELTRMPRKP